jgi:hypothetical protein
MNEISRYLVVPCSLVFANLVAGLHVEELAGGHCCVTGFVHVVEFAAERRQLKVSSTT